MLKTVESTIKQYKMVDNYNSIIIGVSGGSDSMALLDVLLRLLPNKLIVAHLNHKFRGIESDQDAEFVKYECNQRGITVIIKEIDVPRYMKDTNLGAQEAARKVRFQFYLDVAKEVNSNIIALGHHMDDQAETILMRIIRGTGLYGLSGIPYTRDFGSCKIIRPFLDVQKEQIEKYCKENNVKYINDRSNYSTKYFRNEIRINAIPFLTKYNRKLIVHLNQLGKLAQDENNYLNEIAKDFLSENLIKHNDKCILDINLLQTMDIALQRRIIHLILKQYSLNKEINYNNIEDITRIIRQSHPSKSIDLSGIRVYRQYEKLIFSSMTEITDVYKYELLVPGEIIVAEINKKISVFIRDSYEKQEGIWEVFDYDQINNKSLVIRSKKDGDKITLEGSAGTKKIKKLYIDLKIPRLIRNNTPIIESGDNILWLPGIKRSKHAIPQKLTKQFLYIVLKEL